MFSVLDASSRFWQIALDDASSYTTTFNTPYGRYCFLRFPFGITSATEVFQEAMDQLIGSQPCEIIVDDILIWGSDDTKRDAHLREVLKRAREVNLQLNTDKCKIRVT